MADLRELVCDATVCGRCGCLMLWVRSEDGPAWTREPTCPCSAHGAELQPLGMLRLAVIAVEAPGLLVQPPAP